ncbi:uncharacterized protein LOC115449230 [Manduca sexta]|nr:uncharacterized protein LOC115449230 [Manduca sexta]
MWLNAIAPKKFLCHYTLKIGCLFYGVFMTCVMVACTISLIVETFSLSKCTYCSTSVTSFSITAIVYSITMVFIHLWFIWGVNKRKSSVVISWLVITAMWMAQVFCLIIVLLCIFIRQSKPIAWTVLALLCTSIPLYGLLIGYGYWLQLKTEQHSVSVTS